MIKLQGQRKTEAMETGLESSLNRIMAGIGA